MDNARRAARLDIRLDDADKALLTEAASLSRTSLSSFVVGAARERAQTVIAERRRVVLDAESYDEFVAALDAPPRPAPRLRRLLAEEGPFATR